MKRHILTYSGWFFRSQFLAFRKRRPVGRWRMAHVQETSETRKRQSPVLTYQRPRWAATSLCPFAEATSTRDTLRLLALAFRPHSPPFLNVLLIPSRTDLFCVGRISFPLRCFHSEMSAVTAQQSLLGGEVGCVPPHTGGAV